MSYALARTSSSLHFYPVQKEETTKGKLRGSKNEKSFLVGIRGELVNALPKCFKEVNFLDFVSLALAASNPRCNGDLPEREHKEAIQSQQCPQVGVVTNTGENLAVSQKTHMLKAWHLAESAYCKWIL